MIVTDVEFQYALRNLHSEHLLSRTRIATHLKRVFATNSLREALIASVESAFAASPSSSETIELRDIVYRNDIEEAVPRSTAAKNHGISSRTFFRKRRRAIRMVVVHINNSLTSGSYAAEAFVRSTICEDGPSRQPNEIPFDKRDRLLYPLQHRGIEMFEACRANFASNRMVGDVFAMGASIAKLNGFRGLLQEQHKMELEIMDAELNIYLRNFSQASQVLDSAFERLPVLQCNRLWLLALLVRAQLAFIAGNLDNAEALARTVQDASTMYREIQLSAAILLGRIAALVGKPWQANTVSPQTEWDELRLRSVQARHDLIGGQFEAAYEAASTTYEQSLQHNFFPLAAQSAAILAGCHNAMSSERRSSATVDALKSLAISSANADLSRDLFQFSHRFAASWRWLDERADRDLASIYLSLRPQSAFATCATLRQHVPLLIRTILRRLANPANTTALNVIAEPLVHCVNQVEFISGALSNESNELAAFGEFLKVLIPIQRQPTFSRSFRLAAAVVIRALARSRSYYDLRALSTVS